VREKDSDGGRERRGKWGERGRKRLPRFVTPNNFIKEY
jgi:hypothetical protein